MAASASTDGLQTTDRDHHVRIDTACPVALSCMVVILLRILPRDVHGVGGSPGAASTATSLEARARQSSARAAAR